MFDKAILYEAYLHTEQLEPLAGWVCFICNETKVQFLFTCSVT